MPPFDTAHMISYSTSLKTRRLSCTVFETATASNRHTKKHGLDHAGLNLACLGQNCYSGSGK